MPIKLIDINGKKVRVITLPRTDERLRDKKTKRAHKRTLKIFKRAIGRMSLEEKLHLDEILKEEEEKMKREEEILRKIMNLRIREELPRQ